MPVIYNNRKLIPSPFITIAEEEVKVGDNTIGKTYRMTVNGTFVAYKGSPTSSGTFWTDSGYPPDEILTHDEHMKSIIAKQQALRLLFGTEGQLFEIQPWDGSASLKCNPRVLGVTIAEGQWYNVATYSIELEADNLFGATVPSGENPFTEFVTNTSEDWQIELADPQDETVQSTYRMTHTVSAVGRKHYELNGSALDPTTQAKNWVIQRLGLDPIQQAATDVLNISPSYGGYNHVRSQNTNELEGSFSVSESWILSLNNYKEDFNVETTQSTDNGLVQVNIQGNVEGLETRDSSYGISQTKYDAAINRFTTVQGLLLTRANNYGGISLNPSPVSYSIGKNPVTGNINYNYSYNSRPSNLIDGALSEVIEITYNASCDVFAELPVLGRVLGPVLQNINTVTSPSRQLSIQAVFSGVSNIAAAPPDTSSIVTLIVPDANQVFKENDTVNWNPRQGIYSRNISWKHSND